jgi:hypothetical protein
VVGSAMRSLFADEDFRTVLKAENLLDMQEQLHRMGSEVHVTTQERI